MAPKILFVDDEKLILQAIKRQMRKQFAVSTALGGKAGLQMIEENGPYAVVVADMNMPGMNGIEFLLAVQQQAPKTVRIMLTRTANQRTAIDAINQGNIFRFLNKPCPIEDLKHAVTAGIEQHQYILAASSLRISQERYMLAVNGSTDGIWDWDIQSGKVYYSPRFEQLLNLEDGLMTQDFSAWESKMHSQDRSRVLEQIQNHLNNQEPFDIECRLETKERGFRWFCCRGVAVWDELQNATRMAGSIQDIHDRIVAQEQIKQTNIHLAQMTETAHRFVDNVAHDLRTPLTVIKEFASIIADGLGGPVTDQQTEYLEFITSATRDLAQMVDDFLDSSKLKAGVLRVDRQSHAVSKIFESVLPMLRTRAKSKKIHVVDQIQPDLPLVFADADKAERVIVNLAVNAIKFSPEGSEISLWAKSTEDGGVEIGITDCGQGMTQEDLAVIFDRFKQVGDIERASTKGFGLGLNIAKELVWLNLGSICVHSQYEKGSTFSFSLPPFGVQSTILDRYFDRFSELDTSPTQMALLRAYVDEPTFDLEKLRHFMATSCYPMDLIWSAVEDRSVLLMGSTTKPNRWIIRLQEFYAAKIQDHPSDALPPMHIDCVRSLPFLDMRQWATSTTQSQTWDWEKCA